MDGWPYPAAVLAEGVQLVVSDEVRFEILLPVADALELVVGITWWCNKN